MLSLPIEQSGHERHYIGTPGPRRGRQLGQARRQALIMPVAHGYEGGESEPDGVALISPPGQQLR
ncbi:hypothetical protein AB0G86_06100 [Streptomyces scabiei]|uniref:hypothetical protein n=1 Tax=Streptomyces scabiei TaxID=1930 RepID=UPI0033F7885F